MVSEIRCCQSQKEFVLAIVAGKINPAVQFTARQSENSDNINLADELVRIDKNVATYPGLEFGQTIRADH